MSTDLRRWVDHLRATAARASLDPALDAQLAAGLTRAFAQARSTWPQLPLDEERLVRHLAQSLGGELAGLATLHAADLHLALAALAGDSFATQQVLLALNKECQRARHRFDAPPDVADELAQELTCALLMRPKDTPLLARFSGRGGLEPWLRTLVLRAFLERRSTEARAPAPLSEALLERMADSGGLELSVIKEEQRPHFRGAMQRALEQLSTHERTLLRFHLLAGWSIEAIGARYGVHRSSASRWLRTIREKVLATVHGELKVALGVEAPEVTSLARLMRSDLDLSLDRILDA